jgi:ribonuclease P protein component
LKPSSNNASPAPEEGAGERHTFPQKARLKVRREFDAVFKEGKKGVGRALVIYALPNELGFNRLGLAVGKKAGNSVRRNRIKRMIREAFRLETPSLPAGFDIVCIPRTSGFPEKATELIPLFRETFLRAIGAGKNKGNPR